jgi:hypothetical protein
VCALVVSIIEAALAAACILAVLSSSKAIAVELQASGLLAVASLWLPALTYRSALNITHASKTSRSDVMYSEAVRTAVRFKSLHSL